MTSEGAWMIFFGNGCVVFCMIPNGRQCASGLSLLLSAIRFLTSSAAHDWYGAPPSTWSPMLPKREPEGGNSPVPAAATGAGPPPLIPWMVSQTPDRSGLPSAVRGAGAVMLTLPSAVFGVFGAENFGHCA